MSHRIGRRQARRAAKRPPAPSCPNCTARLDGRAPVDSPAVPPRPGDLAACFQCQALLRYEDHGALRLLTRDEYQALPPKVRARLEMARCIVPTDERKTS